MDNLKIEERLDRIERLIISNKKVLTFDEACDYTGLSRSYLYKLTSSGVIPHSKPNGKIIYVALDRSVFCSKVGWRVCFEDAIVHYSHKGKLEQVIQ